MLARVRSSEGQQPDEPTHPTHVLPPGWHSAKSTRTGKSYFYNYDTGESTYHPPLQVAGAQRRDSERRHSIVHGQTPQPAHGFANGLASTRTSSEERRRHSVSLPLPTRTLTLSAGNSNAIPIVVIVVREPTFDMTSHAHFNHAGIGGLVAHVEQLQGLLCGSQGATLAAVEMQLAQAKAELRQAAFLSTVRNKHHTTRQTHD